MRELGAAFAASRVAAEQVRNFRRERLARLVAGELPVPLGGEVKVVLHLVPLGAAGPTTAAFDVESISGELGLLQPLSGGIHGRRYNLDGFLVVAQGLEERRTFPYAYLQVFRDGSVETANSLTLSNEEGKRLNAVRLEREVSEAVARGLRLQRQLGVDSPVVAMLSLLGVRGYVLPYQGMIGEPIDRDALLLPEVLAEGESELPVRLMKPAFDALWNAAGYPRCLLYDEAGQWKGS